ncbi:hypothetical protein A3860_30930 [Niastella vici]|uniref:Clp R domain-containing protein n=1 Tax=Niastella vici TaxID=1703345 RepID=A0A1V9FU64_9BACT|nr:tetratricopeptide repeat protein [Niastella vici]OQP61882.1 hypothetical protein A3860_30930 [Niastella vici]
MEEQLVPGFHSEDITLVMEKARNLAVQYRHGLIDFAHLFVAILSTDSEARAFCQDFNSEKWKAWLQQHYKADSNLTMDDQVPLTVLAEYIIRHANAIKSTNGEVSVCSIHILLALLCIISEVNEAFSRKGIMFEDVAEQYYRKRVERSLPFIAVLPKGPYPAWRKFFITGKSRKEKVRKLYRQAYLLFMYEQYEDCLSVCEAALSLDLGNLDLRYLQLYSSVNTRDFHPALTFAKTFINDHPNPNEFRITLAYIYDELGQYDQSASMLDEILADNPASPTALNNKGFSLYRQGKFAAAIPFYEKAIEADPSFAYPWDNLGFVKYKLGNMEEGLRLIEKALELDKGNSYVYKYKGIILLEQNNRDEALKNFQLALRYGYTKKYGNEVLELMKNIR